MKIKRLKISLFLRKPRVNQNYSVERLFDAVSEALPKERYEIIHYICPYESKGLVRRLLITIWAAFHQGDINHITGDINFIGLFMRRSRTVLTIHDSASMRRLTGVRYLFYYWMWLRLPILRAGRITVISEATLFETQEFIGRYSRKFRVVPNCVTGGLVASINSFNSMKPRILQIGTNENKNLLRVIEAVNGIPCLLVIVGVLSTEQQQLLKDSGALYENHVHIDNAAIVKQYELADVVVFVSTYEGFGLPILEAQTVGRVVITSVRAPMDKVAGSGAVLVNPENVVEIRNAIKKVIVDEQYRNDFIAAGFENVKKYSPEAIASQYATVYEELFEQEKRS